MASAQAAAAEARAARAGGSSSGRGRQGAVDMVHQKGGTRRTDLRRRREAKWKRGK
jgi:hypothetical protein